MAALRTTCVGAPVVLGGVILALVSPCSPANAGDYKDKDFSLRFPAAMNRFSSYADVAGVGGASAGSKWASSVNPAATGWLEIPGRFHTCVNPQYSAICFREGTKLHVATESLTVDLKQWGVFQPAAAQAHSNVRPTKDGLDLDYEMEYYQLQWGKRFGRWAFGLNYNYSPSQLQFDLGPRKVSKTRAETHGMRLGGLCQVAEKLLAGLVLDYSESTGRTVLHDFMGFGIGDIVVHDTTRQYGVRPGMSFEYKKDSAVYFDYQYLRLSNDTGRLRAHRFFAGVDHELIDGFFVRGGMNFDIRGNAAVTCGVGIYPCDWFTIDIGYQCDMFPEVSRELGSSHTFALSLGFTF